MRELHRVARVAFLLVFLSAGLPLALAQSSEKKPASKSVSTQKWEKPIDLPDRVLVRSKLSSVDEAFGRMWISHPFAGADNKLTIIEDKLQLVELRILENLLDRKGEFADLKANNEKIRIYFFRYGISEPRYADVFLKAKDSKIGKVALVTDFNRSMEKIDIRRKKPVVPVFDLDGFKLTNASIGQVLKELFKGGFKINDDQYGVFSQPLYLESRSDPDKIDPIMHLKEMHIVAVDSEGKERPLMHTTGTANISVDPRYNRLIEVKDPLISETSLEHLKRLIAVYAKGGETKKVAPFAPVRIQYADRGYVEIAYTDGKYNPNVRLRNLMFGFAKHPDQFRVKSAIYSHFVNTYRPLVEAIGLGMTVFPEMTVEGVVDDKFVDNDGYGLSSVMEGFDLYRKLGGNLDGWKADASSRVNLKVYQRQIDGRDEIDPEGYPISRHLWHDKTFMLEIEELSTSEDGKTEWVPWTYISTGHFNLSNNFRNAEQQFLIRVRSDSRLARNFKASILGVVQNEPEYAIDLPLALMRKEIAEFLGYSVFEVPLERARQWVDAALDKKWDALEGILDDQRKEKTHLANKITATEVENRINRLKKRFAKGVKEKDYGLGALSNWMHESSQPASAPRARGGFGKDVRGCAQSLLPDARSFKKGTDDFELEPLF